MLPVTVQREEPCLLIACCDECGTRQELDVDTDAGQPEIIATLEELGWLHRAPDRVHFPSASWAKGEVQEYQRDTCPDCQTDEAKPRPVFGRARKPAAVLTLDDPVDEWPRSAIWEAEGLLPACGHRPSAGHHCPQCEAGVPMGENRAWWRR